MLERLVIVLHPFCRIPGDLAFCCPAKSDPLAHALKRDDNQATWLRVTEHHVHLISRSQVQLIGHGLGKPDLPTVSDLDRAVQLRHSLILQISLIFIALASVTSDGGAWS